MKVRSCHILAQKNLLASYCIWTFLKRPYKAIQCSGCAVGSAFRIDIFGEGRKQGGVQGDLKPWCRFNQQQLRPTRIVDNSLSPFGDGPGFCSIPQPLPSQQSQEWKIQIGGLSRYWFPAFSLPRGNVTPTDKTSVVSLTVWFHVSVSIKCFYISISQLEESY